MTRLEPTRPGPVRPDPTGPDPTRPDPTRLDPTRPVRFRKHPDPTREPGHDPRKALVITVVTVGSARVRQHLVGFFRAGLIELA